MSPKVVNTLIIVLVVGAVAWGLWQMKKDNDKSTTTTSTTPAASTTTTT